VDKRDVARVLEQIAVILEIKGENPFKVRAYENAARAIDALEDDLAILVQEERLTQVRGIGSSIATNVTELVKSGKMKYYESLCEAVPAGWLELMRIPGLGPKRIRLLCELLAIASVEELKRAAEQGRVRALKGFGEQSEKKILDGIAFLERGGQRALGAVIRPLAEELLGALKDRKDVLQAEIGGSLRRWLETVKDVDLLVATKKPAPVSKAFLELLPGASITATGETKTSVRVPSGLAIDLRLVTPEQFPFALHYFSGSVAHNVRVRQRALERDMSLNEYELSGAKHAPIKTEADLFQVLDLSYIEPELREDRGEIEAAESGTLPKLVTMADLRGILHAHTTYSDGKSTLAEMAEAAVSAGASYLGITDHSVSARYAGGLSEEDLQRQQKEIDKWNSTSKSLRILKGAEVDILPDGTLDYPDRVLEWLDFVIASVHTNLNMSEEEMTARVVKALRNRYVGIFAHPTGRLILQREGYRLSYEAVFKAAAEEGVVVEINANPRRLELDWREMRAAKAHGLKLAVNPDAHHVNDYLNLRYGIGIARKGWLTAEDVINTYPVERTLEVLRARR
jgi:DNA polymerase (family 10)